MTEAIQKMDKRPGQLPPHGAEAKASTPTTPGNWRMHHPEEGAFLLLTPLADATKMKLVTDRYPQGVVADVPLITATDAKMFWIRHKFPDSATDAEFVRVQCNYNLRAVRMKDEEPRPLGVAPPKNDKQ
jgi:hypothetical protein